MLLSHPVFADKVGMKFLTVENIYTQYVIEDLIKTIPLPINWYMYHL